MSAVPESTQMPAIQQRYRSTVGRLVTLVCLAALVALPAARAAGDTIPPAVTALAASPTSVDTTSSSATVTVTATLTDDLSGVRNAWSLVVFRSPSGAQTVAGTFRWSGGDGYSAAMTLPAHAETGSWSLGHLYLVDQAGNYRYLYPADLAPLAPLPAIVVSGTPDTTAPRIVSVSAAPATVEVGAAAAIVTVAATVTDDLSGVRDTGHPCVNSCTSATQIGFTSPSGLQVVGNAFAGAGGDAYTTELTFPAHAEKGVWRPFAYVADLAGNTRWLSSGELQLSGVRTTIAVADTPGALPPTIRHEVSPAAPDGANGWYVTPPTVTFSCVDATSGVASCLVDGGAEPSVTLSESASPQVVSGTVRSLAGNVTHDTVSGLYADLSDPTVRCAAAGVPTFMVGAANAAVAATVADAISGPEQSVVSVPVSTTAAGSFTVGIVGRDRAGRSTTISCPYTVMAAPTVAQMTTFAPDDELPVSWSAANAESWVASYDVRVQSASIGGSGFSPWRLWQPGTTATSATYPGVPGTTYCFAARARDAHGALTPWSAYKCTAVPVDDRALTALGGWTAEHVGDAYFGTVSRTLAPGDRLVLAGITAKRIGVYATRCRGCGSFRILWNGILVTEISLNYGKRSANRLSGGPGFDTLQTGTLTIEVSSSGKPVEIDGLGVTQRWT